MDTGRLSLERAEDEFVTPQHVNAQPVDVVDRVVALADKDTGRSQCVRFVLEQNL